MSWADEGFDPANLQAGYTPSWKFINAFFRAFQERADYIEGSSKSDGYDDLFLTGSQIGSSELMKRLGSFNGKVVSTFEFNFNLFNINDGTHWFKQSTWDQIVSFNAERIDLTSRQRTTRGLTVIDLDIWDRESLRELLTDVVYEMIFEHGSNQKFFDTRYWGGLYKLLNKVLLHRELSVNYFFDPDPKQPYLVINKRESSGASGEKLSEVIAESMNDTVTDDNGSPVLLSSSVSAGSSFRSSHLLAEDRTSGSANAGYGGNRQEPFCRTPTKMDIEILLWVARGDVESSNEISGIVNEQNGEEVTTLGPPLSSSRTITRVNGEQLDPVFVPSLEAYLSNIAANKHFPISFDTETGTNTVSLASLQDLRSTHSVTQEPSKVGEHEGLFKDYISSRSEGQRNTNILNMAFCSLPQADFEFPAE